jgi:PAS domain S-box-containing protein
VVPQREFVAGNPLTGPELEYPGPAGLDVGLPDHDAGLSGKSAGDARRARPSDAMAVKVVARLRVAVAVGAAAAGSFMPHVAGRRAALFLVLGLAWVPWASVVLFASDRLDNGWALRGGPAGDVLALFAVQSLAPEAKEVVLLGYLVVVAFAIYTAGRSFAALLAAAAMAFTLVSQSFTPASARLGMAALGPFSAAVVALLFLFERTATLQARAVARYERLQSKADTILAHVADAVVVTDATGHVRQCNPAAQRIIDRPNPDVIGLPCAEVLGLHAGERLLDCSAGCQLVALTDGSDPALGYELWRAERDGRRQPLLANATAVTSGEGRLEVVHSLRDITRLKQAEEAKTLFLATASQELKTPLTVIKGFADTLVEYDDLDAETKEVALEAIRVRARELTRIVDRLLLSSRIEAGRVDLALEDVELAPVLEERTVPFALATGRVITCHVPPDLPHVVGNEEALVAVIDHLLDNALKYSPGGEPVAVTATTACDLVRVEVSDHGIGMDTEQASRCCEKFWQAESTDVRRFGGTGIGLYVVQSLVEAIGGRVNVSSERGKGATFVVELRRREEAAVERGPGVGEASSIREFMRQIGVPERSVR